MEVLVNDIFVDETLAEEFGVTFVEREEVIRQADFLTLHCPSTPETKHMIGAEQLQMMKADAILINTARGGLIDENALVAAIYNKTIAGAALDVLEHEPPKGRELLDLAGIVITSHIGGYTKEATNAMSMLAAENAIQVLSGERPAFVVNPEVYKD
jgi:phosphoglycerate dehydrogenase-like enzyme